MLDIGCHQGEMFRLLAGRIGQSVGIDPLARPVKGPDFRLLAMGFSGQLPFPEASFDVITLLATLEHMQEKDALAEKSPPAPRALSAGRSSRFRSPPSSGCWDFLSPLDWPTECRWRNTTASIQRTRSGYSAPGGSRSNTIRDSNWE